MYNMGGRIDISMKLDTIIRSGRRPECCLIRCAEFQEANRAVWHSHKNTQFTHSFAMPFVCIPLYNVRMMWRVIITATHFPTGNLHRFQSDLLWCASIGMSYECKQIGLIFPNAKCSLSVVFRVWALAGAASEGGYGHRTPPRANVNANF